MLTSHMKLNNAQPNRWDGTTDCGNAGAEEQSLMISRAKVTGRAQGARKKQRGRESFLDTDGVNSNSKCNKDGGGATAMVAVR